MKTPGSTSSRKPAKSAQPRTCSRRSPAMRRAISSSSSPSSRASSSAKTEPAARRRSTTSLAMGRAYVQLGGGQQVQAHAADVGRREAPRRLAYDQRRTTGRTGVDAAGALGPRAVGTQERAARADCVDLRSGDTRAHADVTPRTWTRASPVHLRPFLHGCAPAGFLPYG